MDTTLFHHWAAIGARAPAHNQSGHIRITNIIAVAVSLLMLVQLPVLLWLQPAHLSLIALNAVVHSTLLLCVPVFNRAHLHKLGRSVLVIGFASFITFACLLWQHNLNIQHFLLLGSIVIVFIYPATERLRWLSSLLLYSLSFIAIESKFILLAAEQQGNTINLIRWCSSVLLTAGCLIAAFCIQQVLRISWLRLASAHRGSESLLSDLLPASVSTRLKQQQQCVTDFYPSTSVLFADMSGYTRATSTSSLQQMVASLDTLYREFDRICDQYGLRKIKTNGDQYMAVAGVPLSQAAHARLCCASALAMMAASQRLQAQLGFGQGLRIGIASGSLIAGVIGQQGAHYDVWGETVILAARLESQCPDNQILVSQSTYQRAQRQFEFSQQSMLEIKGMGHHHAHRLISKHCPCTN